MNREIEEIARVLNECCNVYDEQGNHIRNKCYECECWSDDNHCCCSYNSKEAEALYNASYRRATDVLREVEELGDLYQTPDGVSLVIKLKDFIKLKKKYESED